MKKIVLLTGAMAMLCLISCTTAKQEKEAATKFVVTNPIQIDTSFTKSYVAQIRSIRNVELRAQEKGFLQNIYVDEGQFVKKGQLLFRINPKMYEAEVLKSRAEEKAAEIELQNSKSLADKEVVSKNELAMSQAKLQQAQAELQLAQLHLSYTEIRAPFDGTIDRIPLKLGSLVDEGELLTVLSDNSEMYSYFNVSEPEYLDYQANTEKNANQKVGLLLANNTPFEYTGKVELIESEFNNETGNIAFRARFPNAKRLLKNGQTGEVQMNVQLPKAIVIPQKVTYEIQDKKYVFVVDSKNTIRSREISVGAEMPDLYVITKGLLPSDKILLEGVQKVKDDERISYTYESPRKVITGLRLKAE